MCTLLEHIELEPGSVLWESDQKTNYLYFPVSGLISLVYESDTGSSVSIGLIGRSGIVGTGIMTGNVRTPDRALVIYQGDAYRMKAASVLDEMADCGAFQGLLLAYTHAFMVQVSQNAICNRLHRIEQQLGRLLLEIRDQIDKDELKITHDVLAGILGVRRESVSLAASSLQRRKLIKASRGRVEIKDRDGLEHAACECYSIVNDQLEQCLTRYTEGQKE
ncbi:MAG: Crp/Fnr family transcriptional regulator [Chloracidobacterium sp.]|nr:Crp/Fnr family transcriptional regulator [Chloracidobacterium sp.]